jgi:hypothetical protein
VAGVPAGLSGGHHHRPGDRRYGGFWFIPATHIASFWAFLLGVCIIADGLTFLEAIANPYATVLGPPEYAANRIDLAQSCNGIGLLPGPIAGGIFFDSKDAAGASMGAEQMWIPYAAIGVIVIVLAVVFAFAEVPKIKLEGDYHLDDSAPAVSHSIWSHPHFAMAVVAQFLYVGAQAGIFNFFLNYMTPRRRRSRLRGGSPTVWPRAGSKCGKTESSGSSIGGPPISRRWPFSASRSAGSPGLRSSRRWPPIRSWGCIAS